MSHGLTISVLHADDMARSERELLETLTVQKTRLQQAPTLETADKGFIMYPFTKDSLTQLVQTGALLLAKKNDKVIGYLVLTPGFDFYADEIDSPLVGRERREAAVKVRESQYVYQVAVDPAFDGLGVGSQLIERAKAIAPKGLTAEIMAAPVPNAASFRAFSKAQFHSLGQVIYRDDLFPVPYRKHLMYWP